MTDYILDARDYLPKFLKDSSLMLSIMDCLNVLISTENTVFREIKEAYDDTLYKVRDYSKLSYGAKIEIIKELGFDYVLDIIELTSEQLTQLITFFNLIYSLKGKREGLELVLDILGLTYTYVVWDEVDPKRQLFTARLTIVGNNYAEVKVFKKIKNFVRSYMLPWIEVIIETTTEPALFYLANLWGAGVRYKEEEKYGTGGPTIPHPSISNINYIRIGEMDTFKIRELDELQLIRFIPY